MDMRKLNELMVRGLNRTPESDPVDQRHWQDMDAIRSTEGSVHVQPHWAKDAKAYAAEQAAEQHEDRFSISTVNHSGGIYEVKSGPQVDPQAAKTQVSADKVEIILPGEVPTYWVEPNE